MVEYRPDKIREVRHNEPGDGISSPGNKNKNVKKLEGIEKWSQK